MMSDIGCPMSTSPLTLDFCFFGKYYETADERFYIWSPIFIYLKLGPSTKIWWYFYSLRKRVKEV